MKILLKILLLILFEQTVFGQIDSKKLETIFDSKSINQLELELEKLSKDKSSSIGNVWVQNVFNGEILNEVIYHQLELTLVVPVKVGNYDHWGEKTHFIEFLSKKGTIFFRRITDEDEKCVKRDFNESQLSSFISDYERLFGTKISRNYDNLIIYENGYYGLACGFAGTLPEKGEKMKELITKKDSKELLNWVKSLSPLSQAYGVLGMYILERKGFHLSEADKVLIEIVRNKSIAINTCEGCFMGTRVPLKSLLTIDKLKEAYQYLK